MLWLPPYRYTNIAPLGASSPAWVLTSGGTAATLDADFVNNLVYLNGALSSVAALLACTRATPVAAYYTKADGTLTTFAANTLRYGTNGVLVEAASANLVVRSQELDDAAWTKTDVTVTANDTTAPDGTTTADLLTEGSAGTALTRTTAGTISAGVTQAASIYIKRKSGSNWVRLSMRDDPLTNGPNLYVDIANGVLGSHVNSGTGVFTSVSLDTLANGWYRINLIGSPSAGATTAAMFVCSATADGNATRVSASAYWAWGAQIESGSITSQSSYVPTTSASVTRAVDVPTFLDLTWFDGANDTLYAEWVARNTNNAKVWALDATNDKLIDEQTGMSARIAGATVANTASAGATVKAAARLTLNNFGISMNGGTAATDVSETAPGTLTASRLGVDLAGANSLNGYIRRVAAFKGLAAIDAALVTLAT